MDFRAKCADSPRQGFHVGAHRDRDQPGPDSFPQQRSASADQAARFTRGTNDRRSRNDRIFTTRAKSLLLGRHRATTGERRYQSEPRTTGPKEAQGYGVCPAIRKSNRHHHNPEAVRRMSSYDRRRPLLVDSTTRMFRYVKEMKSAGR
jgi:hypothetical protein